MRSSAPAASEAELVRRCRNGERGAWVELVHRYSAYVYSIVKRGFRLSDADAEDVFQEVFARTYQRLHTLDDDDAIRPWIAQMTRRLAIDHLRASGRETLLDELPEEASPDRVLENLAEAMTVRDALATLDETCREMLDRFYTRDQSRKTIGRELGLPDGTIASRISRCLDKLKQVLASEPDSASGTA